MITNNKIYAHLNRLYTNQLPITADIFLDNYCNNNCPYCVYKRWELEKGVSSMSYSDFIRYAERLKELGVQGFILTGGGEPTICKDFDKITKWLEDNNYHYGINTNFNILKLIKPDYLKISLDGWDKKSYLEKRGSDKYHIVLSNIKAYLKWKKTNNVKTKVGLQAVVTSVDDVLNFYNAHKNLDIDYIAFRPIESTDGEYYKNDENKKIAQDIINILQGLKKADDRILIHYKWFDIETSFSYCVAHWAQIAINQKGEVIYCCHKPYEIIGHIMDDDIIEKHHKAVTNMKTCDIPCRMTGPNNHILELKEIESLTEINFI